MTQIETVLLHKVLPPREIIRGSRAPGVILLHGRGANEDDLLSLAGFLDRRLVVIAPRAPYPFQYGGGFTWYDTLEIGQPVLTMHLDSCKGLLRFCDEMLNRYSINPEKLFLLGFSMGAMMAFTISLAHPGKFAGVVATSGYIPEGTLVRYQWDELAGTHYRVAHGTYDPVVPVQLGRRAKELLEKTGAALEYREYPMGHEISPESLSDTARWLTAEIDR